MQLTVTDSAKMLFIDSPPVIEVLAYILPLCSEMLKHSLQSVDVRLLNTRPLPSQPLGQVYAEGKATVDPLRAPRLGIGIDGGKY